MDGRVADSLHLETLVCNLANPKLNYVTSFMRTVKESKDKYLRISRSTPDRVPIKRPKASHNLSEPALPPTMRNWRIVEKYSVLQKPALITLWQASLTNLNSFLD